MLIAIGTAPYAEDASNVLDISNSASYFTGNKVSTKLVTRRFSVSKPNSPLDFLYK